MKNNITNGLIFKSSTDRLLVKPKMNDLESVTDLWSTIAVDKGFIN